MCCNFTVKALPIDTQDPGESRKSENVEGELAHLQVASCKLQANLRCHLETDLSTCLPIAKAYMLTITIQAKPANCASVRRRNQAFNKYKHQSTVLNKQLVKWSNRFLVIQLLSLAIKN